MLDQYLGTLFALLTAICVLVGVLWYLARGDGAVARLAAAITPPAPADGEPIGLRFECDPATARAFLDVVGAQQQPARTDAAHRAALECVAANRAAAHAGARTAPLYAPPRVTFEQPAGATFDARTGAPVCAPESTTVTAPAAAPEPAQTVAAYGAPLAAPAADADPPADAPPTDAPVLATTGPRRTPRPRRRRRTRARTRKPKAAAAAPPAELAAAA